MFQNNFSLYDDKVVIFYNTDSESSTVIKAQDTKNLLQELENHKDNALLVDKVAKNIDSNVNDDNLQTLSNRITTTKQGNVHKDSSILSQSLKTQGNIENIVSTPKKVQKENLFETKFKQVAIGGTRATQFEIYTHESLFCIHIKL